MKDFFTYESPYRTSYFLEHTEFEIQLTLIEKIMPFIVLFVVIFLLYRYREIFKENKALDKKVRYITAVVFSIVYASHYLLRLRLYGFDTLILPFHLCSIAMPIAIALLLTKNRTIYTFTLFAGLGGALISYATPVIGYNSLYYRYYQFYIAHGLLIVTPLYFLFVHGFIPTMRQTINAFIILNVLALFMTIFNYYMGTDFMFLFIDQAKIEKFPAIDNFGGIPRYLILVELAGFSYFALGYILVEVFDKILGGDTK